MSGRASSVEQKDSSKKNPLFRYNFVPGDRLSPIVSTNASNLPEYHDKLDQEPKISFAVYGSGGENQVLFMKSIFRNLQILEEQTSYENKKDQIHFRYAEKGCLLLFMYSELRKKTPKDNYKRIVQSFIKGFFHYQSTITIIFVDNTKDQEDNYHVDWFKHYFYETNPDQEYFVVYCIKEEDCDTIINRKQMEKHSIINITGEYQEKLTIKANSYRFTEKKFPNLNYFYFLIPSDTKDIFKITNDNSSVLNFFQSKISTSRQDIMKQINPKQKDPRTFVYLIQEYLTFIFSQVISGKRFPDEDGFKFKHTEINGSIHIDPVKTYNGAKSLKLTSIDLINFNPKLSMIPLYSWKKENNQILITFRIAASTIKIGLDKAKDGENIVKITKLPWKVLKSAEEAKKSKEYFSTHLQEVPEFLIKIPLSTGVMKKKVKIISTEKGFLKVAFDLEEEVSD